MVFRKTASELRRSNTQRDKWDKESRSPLTRFKQFIKRQVEAKQKWQDKDGRRSSKNRREEWKKNAGMILPDMTKWGSDHALLWSLLESSSTGDVYFVGTLNCLGQALNPVEFYSPVFKNCIARMQDLYKNTTFEDILEECPTDLRPEVERFFEIVKREASAQGITSEQVYDNLTVTRPYKGYDRCILANENDFATVDESGSYWRINLIKFGVAQSQLASESGSVNVKNYVSKTVDGFIKRFDSLIKEGNPEHDIAITVAWDLLCNRVAVRDVEYMLLAVEDRRMQAKKFRYFGEGLINRLEIALNQKKPPKYAIIGFQELPNIADVWRMQDIKAKQMISSFAEYAAYLADLMRKQYKRDDIFILSARAQPSPIDPVGVIVIGFGEDTSSEVIKDVDEGEWQGMAAEMVQKKEELVEGKLKDSNQWFHFNMDKALSLDDVGGEKIRVVVSHGKNPKASADKFCELMQEFTFAGKDEDTPLLVMVDTNSTKFNILQKGAKSTQLTLYPSTLIYTTAKKRTSLQAQPDKNNVFVGGCKDFVMYTNKHFKTIDGGTFPKLMTRTKF